MHASLLAVSRTQQDFAGDSSDQGSKAKEANRRGREGEKRCSRGTRRRRGSRRGEGKERGRGEREKEPQRTKKEEEEEKERRQTGRDLPRGTAAKGL